LNAIVTTMQIPLETHAYSQKGHADAYTPQMPSPLHVSSLSHHHLPIPVSYTPLHLVLRSSLLACLQLIQVPSANRQAPLVIVHALAEVVDIGRARAALRRGVDLRVLLRELGVLG